MSYDLGTARGVIEMEYNGRAIDQAQRDLQDLNEEGKKATKGWSVDDAGKAAGRAGLAVAAGLGAAVATAASFESRMSAIGAVSGATVEEMDKVRDKALQLGADTAFSAGESAQAMEELIKAGLSVEDVLNGAADATVALAAAGEVGMEEAATIAGNAMGQFGLAAKDMENVANKIAGAANASAISVSDLGQSMSQVGAVANLAGVSFDDTATAIALMGNAGIKGGDAGTSLKSMLSRLQPTTQAMFNEMTRLGLITFDTNGAMKTLAENGIKGVTETNAEDKLRKLAADLADAEVGSAKAEAKFQELGLQTGFLSNQFYDAQGNTKSLAEISETLGSSLDGMNKRQKQATLQTLFGSDAIRAAAIMSEAGAEGFNKMADSMGKVTAAEVAEKRLDNFKGSLDALMGSLETLAITIGSVLLPPLRSFVDWITNLANKFLSLSDTQQKVIVGIIAAVGALLLIVAAVVKVVRIIQTLQATLVAIRAVMATTWMAALGPIALVIAAIAAIVGIFVLLYKKNETFRNLVNKVWGAIKNAVGAVADWFTGTLVPALVGAWDAIVSGVKTAVDAIVAAWNWVKDTLSAVWDGIKAIVQAGVDFIKLIITGWVNIITAIWTAFWNTFGGIIKAAWGLVVAILKLGWTIVKGLFLIQLAIIKKIWTTVWNAIVKVVKWVWDKIMNAVRFYTGLIKKVITTVWNAIKAATSAVWESILAVLNWVWDTIGARVWRGLQNIWDKIQDIWNKIKDITKSVWNWLVEEIGGRVLDIVDKILGIKDKVVDFFTGAKDWLFDAGKDIIQGILDGIESMINAVKDKVEKVTDIIGKFLPGSPVEEGPLVKLNRGKTGKEIVQMVIDGIDEMAPALNRAMAHAMPAFPLSAPTSPHGLLARPTAPTVSPRDRGGLQVAVYNPVPERAGQSVSKVLRTKVEEEGWLT